MNTRINLTDLWLKNFLSCLIGDHYEMKVSADSDYLFAETLGALRRDPLYGPYIWVLVSIKYDSISIEWGKCNHHTTLPSWDEMAGYFTGMLKVCATPLKFERSEQQDGDLENYVNFTLNL